MKILFSLSLMICQVCHLIAQTQLSIIGTYSGDPVAFIDVLGDQPNGLSATGLKIHVIGDSSADMMDPVSNTGIDIEAYSESTGIYVRTEAGAGGDFFSTNSNGIYARSNFGTGIYAETLSTNPAEAGIYGLSSSNGEGTGIWGHATGTLGDNYGVRGESNSITGTGVYGSAKKYGIHGSSIDGLGVKGESISGVGGEFSSKTQIGLSTASDDDYGMQSISTDASGAYVKGRNNLPDLVLGIDKDVEGEDDGIISSDLSQATTDMHFIANDKIIIELDNDDNEDSYFQVLDGKNNKILTLDENGNLDITGAYSPMSDVNRKHDIIETDYKKILNKLSELKIYNWKYKGDNRPHVGPMAQDFYASFHLNDSDTSIATVDADGIALASIKALQEQLSAQQKEIADLKKLLFQMIKKDKL